MHWHDYLEIALVLEGSGAFLFGRREQPVEPGDVFFVDNSQPHVALPDPAAPLRLLLVLFRPELIAGPGCRELDLGYLAPFRVDERVASPRICGGTCLAAELAPILRELREASARHDPTERHLLDATLRLALGLVIRDRGAGSADAAARADADRREQIRPVLSYVDRHCRESITLDDVAQVVHLSPSRVRHVFQDVTGVGFKEYVTHVRLAEAKRLLLATDLSAWPRSPTRSATRTSTSSTGSSTAPSPCRRASTGATTPRRGRVRRRWRPAPDRAATSAPKPGAPEPRPEEVRPAL